MRKTTALRAPRALPAATQSHRHIHFVNGHRLQPLIRRTGAAVSGSVFWAPERKFWELAMRLHHRGGLCGGHTQNPTYEEVCSGRTRHTEAVLWLSIREDSTIGVQGFWRVTTRPRVCVRQ